MPRRPLLEFEKPLVELEQQIDQIRQLARDSEVDVSQQLLQLETLAERRRQEIFQGLTPARKFRWLDTPIGQAPWISSRCSVTTGLSCTVIAAGMMTRRLLAVWAGWVISPCC